jgi:hypothetical protein
MPYSDTLDVRVTDTCLRDGSHAKHHQFTEERGALDRPRPSTTPACR